MRLSEREKSVILDAAQRRFGPGVQVRLFGSRTDDAARGGDIDLLLELPFAIPDSFTRALAMEVDIQLALDDPKVDILVTAPPHPLQPIHRIALETGVLL